MLKLFKKFSAVFTAVLLFTYCSDSIIESTPSIVDDNEIVEISAKFSEIQSEIFNKSCAFSDCHAGSVSPDLSGNAYSNIVNRSSSTGMLYIKPNDPDNSYLLQKIIGSGSINGSRMPLGASPISQENTDKLIEWINNGAQNN